MNFVQGILGKRCGHLSKRLRLEVLTQTTNPSVNISGFFSGAVDPVGVLLGIPWVFFLFLKGFCWLCFSDDFWPHRFGLTTIAFLGLSCS